MLEGLETGTSSSDSKSSLSIVILMGSRTIDLIEFLSAMLESRLFYCAILAKIADKKYTFTTLTGQKFSGQQ